MKVLRIAIVIFIILIIGAFLQFTAGHDIQTLLIEFMEQWATSYGWLIGLFIGLTIISTLSGLPIFYLSVALGFFISYMPALGIAVAANVLAVMLTFYMVRGMFREYFIDRYGKKKTIKRINSRVEKYGLWTIALSRSIYIIPTNIINFSFPLSKIKPSAYFSGTVIGVFVESLINVSTGYLLKNQVLLLDSPEQNYLKIIIIGVAIATLGIVLFTINRRSKQKKSKIRKVIVRQ